ncbi:MAG TPA: BBE domain-containing protein, partial [Clostridia bacterium]|nr:BBE domain-containing protein [Clostridia bacterium]
LPFPKLQALFDPLLPPGLQWYWRGDFLGQISDEAMAIHQKYAQRFPDGLSIVHIYPIDGAASRVLPGATAFSYRDAKWSMVIAGIDPNPANSGLISRWAKEYWEELHPYSLGGAYVNFMMDEGATRIVRTYRDNFRRLTQMKRKYDPTNLFCVNQNILPGE